MSDAAPPPPPPPPPPPTTPPPPVGDPSAESAPERLAHPWVLFAAAGGAGVLAAGIFGGGIGWLVAAGAGSDCSPSDGWCELGAVLFGIFAAIVAGAIAYIVAGVMVIRRCRPSGRRAIHVLVHLAAPFALVLLLALLAGLTG